MSNKAKKIIYILMWLILGMMIAIIVHGLIEIPLLAWANRGGEWHTFLGFTNYDQFRVVDEWMAVAEFIIFIVISLMLGRHLSKSHKK